MSSRRRIAIALAILACTPFARAPAQEKEIPRTIETVAFPIASVRMGKGGTATVAIPVGAADGVVVGWRGVVRAVRPSDDPTPNAEDIGRAEVVTAEKGFAIARVTLSNEKTSVGRGDVLELRCRVPKIAGRGVLWKLACMGILLKYSQTSGKLYYTYREIAAQGDAEFERRKLAAMLEAIHASGKTFGDKPVLTKVLTEGRYKGRTTADLMVNATVEELETFLQFVEGFPGKYYGKSWNIDEIYATWLINFAPYSDVEVAALLEQADRAEDRAELLAKNPKLARAAVDLVEDRSGDYALADRFEEAERALQVVREAAQLWDDERLRRDVLFREAYILHERRQFEAALAGYDALLARLRTADPRGEPEERYESAVLHNRAIDLNSLGRNEEALEAYAESIRLKVKLGFKENAIASTRDARADLLRTLGRHVEAIAEYQRAEVGFRDLFAREGLNDAISGRAKSLTKLGRSKEAAAAYGELIREHRRLGAWHLEAFTWIDLGSQRWDLGDYAGAEQAYAECLRLYEEHDAREGMGRVFDNLGRLQANQGKYELARKSYASASEHYLASGNEEDAAEVAAQLGKIALDTGRFDEGMRLLGQALEQHEKLKNRWGQIHALTLIGNARSGRQEYELALASFDRCVELAREMKLWGKLAETLRNRAGIAQVLKDTRRSEADLSEALELVRKTGERGEEAEVLIALAEAAWFRRDFEAAASHQAAALALARAIGNRLLEGNALALAGRLAGAQYDLDKAIAELHAALEIYADSDVSDPQRIADVRLQLAYQYADSGQWEAGRAQLQEALKVARECGATTVVHEALLRLAYSHIEQGAYAEAKARIDEAAAVEGLGAWAEASRLYARAAYAQTLGEGAAALKHMREALVIYERLRNDWQIATTENYIAHLLRAQGDAEQARPHIAKALPAMKRIGDLGSLTVIETTFGEIETDLGNYDAALQRFDAALGHARASGAPARIAEVLLYVGRCHLRQGKDLDAAEQALRQAVAAYEKLDSRYFEAESRLELASVTVARGADATAQLDAVEPLVTSTASPHLEWRYHDLRSRSTKDLDEALAHRRKAIAVLDKLRAGVGADERAQRQFLRSKIRIYESMAELLGQRLESEKDPEKRKAFMNEALAFLARARFEILRQDVTAGGGSGSPAVDKLRDQIAQAERDVAKLEARIRDAKANGNTALEKELTKVLARDLEKLAELHDNLAAADTDFAARIKFNPAYFEGWAALPENARLVIYFPGVSSLYVWVYGSDGFIAWKQHAIGRDRLHGLVREFRDGIDEVIAKAGSSKGRGFGPVAEANPNNPEWYCDNCRRMREVLTELYGHLLAPIREEVAGAEPLLILPYGLLSYLPFEALMDEQGAFLGAQRRMAYFVHKDHMSLTLSRLGQSRPDVPDFWCAFADPVGKLNTALEEVGEIAPLFAKHDVHTQASGTATESDLLTTPEECTILHFATHGYLSGDRPSDTYIELAPAPPEDGRLMQKEIWPRLRTRLPSIRKRNLRLVVLSACETARGASAPEAEVLGLPEKFAAVGVPTVVASLWSVYTWSTTDLMVNFYTGLRQKDRGIAGALTDARRALLKDRDNGRYAHPYYWAPFLVFGDWR